MNIQHIKNSIWFITGGSKGMGLHLAKRLLKSGAKVAVTSRSSAAVTEKLGSNDNLLALAVDLANEGSVRDAVKQTIDRFGGLDVVVNNAGYGQFGAVEEVSDAEARANFDVNVFGILNVLRASLPQLRKQRSGHVFNIASIAGITGGFPSGIKVLRLGYRESGYAVDFAGSFRCDDDFLNRLRSKAERTLYLTMRDTYMDCPDRERAQWWGDVVNELGEVFYAFDRRADALTRKAMLELIAWQKPDGVLFSPIPAGNWERDLPLQMLASIGRQGFWTYAYYSGDFETLRATYAGVKRYLEIWDLQPDGLIKPRPGSWPWGDWGKNVDMTLLANIWYHLALQGQLNTATALGYKSDLPWIEGRMRSIEHAFDKTFWTGHEFRSPDYQGMTDDRANALAVVAGLARPEQYPEVLSVLRAQQNASPYMEKYVLEALCLMGEPAFAQQRMRQRYARMVDHPEFTTLWEGWGIGKEGFGGGTINHAWSGGPLTIMSQYFAGIAPTSPAFATYSVLPQLGELREIAASVETQRGSIKLTIHRRTNSFALELNSPPQTSATVGLPVGKNEEITRVQLNGRVVWELGQNRSKIHGVKSLGQDGGYLRFAVPAGEWAFIAEVKSKL